MNMTIIAICAICLVAAILIENKFKIPLGLTCMLAAFVINFLGFKMSASKVIGAYFPSTIVMPLILAMIFFSVFTANGTSQVIAKKILSLIRGNMKLYPWTLLGLCGVLYIFLDGGAMRYIITPMIFSVAVAGGGSILMAISTAYLAFVAGSLNPFIGMDATTRIGIFTDMGLANASSINIAMWLPMLFMILVTHLVIYVSTKSWKVSNLIYSGEAEKIVLTPEQKKSFVILAVTTVLFVVPPTLCTLAPSPFTNTLAQVLSIYTVFIIGALMVLIFGLSEWKNMLRTVSMKSIMMIVGVTMLIKTAQQAGLQDLCISVAGMMPPWLIPPTLLLIGAVLSFFVAAPTVLPMLFPMAASMASSPAQAIVFVSCIALGTAASGISPISSSGAAFLSTVEEKDRDIYSQKMFLMAIVGPIIMAVVAATGILEILVAPFASWYY